jgi:hypothetical protein
MNEWVTWESQLAGLASSDKIAGARASPNGGPWTRVSFRSGIVLEGAIFGVLVGMSGTPDEGRAPQSRALRKG